VCHDQLADDPQPETHAAALCGGRVLVALEDAQSIRRADARTLIAHRDGHARGRLAHDQPHPAAVAELQRVRE